MCSLMTDTLCTARRLGYSFRSLFAILPHGMMLSCVDLCKPNVARQRVALKHGCAVLTPLCPCEQFTVYALAPCVCCLADMLGRVVLCCVLCCGLCCVRMLSRLCNYNDLYCNRRFEFLVGWDLSASAAVTASSVLIKQHSTTSGGEHSSLAAMGDPAPGE